MEYFQEFYNPFIKQSDYPEVIEIVSKLFPKQREQLRKNIVMYIINLIVFGGVVAVIRGKDNRFNTYKGTFHTQRLGLKAQDLLEEEGFVKIEPGYRSMGFEKGFASRLQATERFWNKFQHINAVTVQIDRTTIPDMTLGCKEIGIKFNVKPHITLYDNGIEPPIESLLESSYTIKPGSLILLPLPGHFYEDTEELLPHSYYPKLVELPQEFISKLSIQAGIGEPLPGHFHKILFSIYELNNSYFSKMKLGFNNIEVNKRNFSMTRNVYLTRMYSRNMDGLGRLYQKGSKSYQNIKKEDRKHLTINGKHLIEVDFKSLHPNLLYALQGIQNTSEDIYADVVLELIGREDDKVRKVVKLYTLILVKIPTMNGGAFN